MRERCPVPDGRAVPGGRLPDQSHRSRLGDGSAAYQWAFAHSFESYAASRSNRVRFTIEPRQESAKRQCLRPTAARLPGRREAAVLTLRPRQTAPTPTHCFGSTPAECSDRQVGIRPRAALPSDDRHEEPTALLQRSRRCQSQRIDASRTHPHRC